MAIADPAPAASAPTQETGSLPRLLERDRRRFAAVPRPAPGRYLAVEDGAEIVLIPVPDGVCHIGRSPACHVVLDDPSVSRRHAVLTRRGDRTVVLDDRSLNGVQVEGRRVAEAVLRDGDAFLLGRVLLRYVEVWPEGAPPAA